MAAAAALNVIKGMKVHENLDLLTKFVNYDVDMAIYLEGRLAEIYDASEVRRVYFNVVFPRRLIPESVISKYILMKVGKDRL